MMVPVCPYDIPRLNSYKSWHAPEQFLARLDEIQEELLYYPPASLALASALAKILTLKFFSSPGPKAPGELIV